MAILVGKKNAPSTAGKANKTPAPVTKLTRNQGGIGYGQGNYGGPSSVTPGQTVQSELAANIRATVDDDGVLDSVIAKGTAKSDVGYKVAEGTRDSDQLRKISDKNVPTHPHMSGPSKSGTVPGAVSDNSGALPKNAIPGRP